MKPPLGGLVSLLSKDLKRQSSFWCLVLSVPFKV
jgi:hypothetical protein